MVNENQRAVPEGSVGKPGALSAEPGGYNWGLRFATHALGGDGASLPPT